jgi:hypothetical protein
VRIKKAIPRSFLVHLSPQKYLLPSLLSDTVFAGALGHGGVEGRPMKKLDRCCRSRTSTTATTTSSCTCSRPRRHRRQRRRSARKVDCYYRSGFLFLELHHQIRRTEALSTRSTDWISMVYSSSSFSMVLFPTAGVYLGGKERK